MTTPNSDLSVEAEGLVYALDRVPTSSADIVTVMVKSSSDGTQLLERLALAQFRARKALAIRVAATFSRHVDAVVGHLALLLDSAELSVEVEISDGVVELSPARRAAAEHILMMPNILDAAANVMEQRGYVGEETNKKLTYLIATSRKLRKPLSGIARAASATGKSELLEQITAFVPEEDVKILSRITPFALFYAGNSLEHRLIVVDETGGTSDADYAVRTLQTTGSLRLALPQNGKVENVTANGPVALLSSTTSIHLNAENLSRCIALKLDESVEQTARVQAAQRRAWTGKSNGEDCDLTPWKDAQRLLAPLDVTIPFAERLTFPARTTADRRDNGKFLSLIASHALLNQLQRDMDEEGRVVATVADYAAIYELTKTLVETTTDNDLSPRATVLYRALMKRTSKTFTRTEVVKVTGQSYMTLSRALDELISRELVVEVDHSSPRTYQILAANAIRGSSALTHPHELDKLTGVTKTVVSAWAPRTNNSVGA